MNFILSISVGVVKLTGPAGTGKTRLLQQLQTELQAERQETLLFLTPPTSIKDLHDTITRQLKLDNEFGFNKALIHHIIAKPYDQQRLVVIFDNAELIDIDVLLAIALFRNVMHNNQPIVSIVLCGNEALNTKLEDISYRPLVQDLLLSYEIHPLTREQLQAYGHACADIHRLGKLPLKNGVLTELLNESKGLPGAVPDLLKKLKEKVTSGAVAVKVEDAPAAVAAAAVVAAPQPAPAPTPAKAPFRLFGRKEQAQPAPKLEPVMKTEPAPASTPVAKAEAPVPEAPVANVAPVAKVATVAKAAPVAKAVPVSKAVPVAKVTPPAKPAALVTAQPLPHVEAPAAEEAAAASLTADERLILASRAEKDAADARKFRIDWQEHKPALQRTALAAGLLVAVVVAWPRVGPQLGNLYTSLMSGTPAPPPAQPAAPPADVATAAAPAETPAPAAATPQVAEQEPPAEAPPAQEAAPAIEEIEEEVAVAAPEPVAVEPAPAAPEAEPEPELAAAEPAPAAPAPQVTRIAGPTLTDASPDELEMVIRDWLMAWQDQDIDDFFSYYHTDFAPLYQDTLAAWRADRQTKISRPDSIMIELEDLMIGPSSRIGTRVSFWMTYESPTYADRTLKEVLIGQDLDGRWRILQEYNQQTAPLMASRAPSPAAPAPASSRTQVASTPAPQSASPAPVQPPQVAARAALSQDQIDGIARFLADWLTAWQNQDVDGYFRHYEPAYKPDFMASTEQWRNDRIAKISRPQRIVLRMDQLEILAGDADNVRVQLVLEYHSTHYADRTVKEIDLRKAPSGDWLIAQEKNREVVPLPLMRLLPIDSLAYLVMR